MTMEEIISEIKLELTGGILELEIEDKDIEDTVKKALRELQRYGDETLMVTIPFASCINFEGTPLEDSIAIVKIYRTEGIGNANGDYNSTLMDPLYAQQGMVFSNAGTMYNLQDYILNYAAWSTLSQIRNTLSTDVSFDEDRQGKRLYINNNMSSPSMITVKYIPKLSSPEDIHDQYWLDVLIRLSTDLVKIVLGRIRTRFSLSNTLGGMDGDKMLEEGSTDLKELRETLRLNNNMVFGID